jgi:hypothetical protein
MNFLLSKLLETIFHNFVVADDDMQKLFLNVRECTIMGVPVCPSCMPMIGGPVVLSGYSGFFHHYNWSP